MRYIITLLLSIVFTYSLSAQDAFIKVTNTTSDKEAIFKVNKRIRLLTKEGYQTSGKFSIENDETISIGGRLINIMDIIEIKRNPMFTSVLTSTVFIYSGALMTGIGVIAGIFVQPTAYLLAIPGAGLIYTGIKSPNFHKNYKNAKGWKIEITTNAK